MPIRLVVGLGNPGDEHCGTRHNAGADFVAELARAYGADLRPQARLFGLGGRVQGAGLDLRLLAPTTFMNCSGRAVAAAANFYKIATEDILVAHDELDFAPGVARFKDGGGHGGHNGLRDISKAAGDAYLRLRLGIGHPGDSRLGASYVLKRPSRAERALIDAAIAAAIDALPLLAAGDWTRATHQLHNAAPPAKAPSGKAPPAKAPSGKAPPAKAPRPMRPAAAPRQARGAATGRP